MCKVDGMKEYFRRVGKATVQEAARDLGVSRESAYLSIQNLVKRGWLVKSDDNLEYQYQEISEQQRTGAASREEMAWRAIRIANTFTCWDIAMYAGLKLDWVQEYVAYLRNQGLIIDIGKKGNRRHYKIKENASPETPLRNPADRITEVDRIKEHLLDLAGGLLRAIRDDDRDNMTKLSDDIRKKLKMRAKKGRK